MSFPAKITTHERDARFRVLDWWRTKPNFLNVLGAATAGVQSLENRFFPMLTGRFLVNNNPYGAQLDGIGDLVGVARNGMSDAQYLTFILGAIAENNSLATNEVIVSIAETLFGSSDVYVISNFSLGHSHRMAPAVIGLEVGSPKTAASQFPYVLSILQNALAAAVGISFVSTFASGDAFTLAGPASGKGLGDATSANSGGKLASIIYSSPII